MSEYVYDLLQVREWLEKLVTDAKAKVKGSDHLTHFDEGGPVARFDIQKEGHRFGITIRPLP